MKKLILFFVLISFVSFGYALISWTGNIFPVSGYEHTEGSDISVYYQIFEVGVTDYYGQGPNITAKLYYKKSSEETYTSVSMTYQGDVNDFNDDEYTANIPDDFFTYGDVINFYCEAYDVDEDSYHYAQDDPSNVPYEPSPGIYTIADAPLPVILTSFTAKALQSTVELTWVTESETENSHFLIYRNNEAIAYIEGAGTTSERHNYEYIDDQIIPGNIYTYVLADVSYANEETKYADKAVTITIPENDIPTGFALYNNKPNPFNPITAISYQLSADSDVELSVFNMNGSKVVTLVNINISAGYHIVNWDASDYISGIYFYRLRAGDFVETKKMILLK